MSARRRRRAPPEYVPGTLLDWTDSSHWSWEQLPCRYCGSPTHLRDSHGKPAHKVHAEAALARQAAEAADAYQIGHRPMDSCDDCNRSNCPDCATHYCCEPCPCALSHNCPCACAEFERRAMAD